MPFASLSAKGKLFTAQERVAGCSDNARRIFANAGCLQKKPFRLL